MSSPVIKTTTAAATFAALALLAAPGPAVAGSDQQAAVQQGAVQMTSEEIEALIVGNTVKARIGEKMFLFYYSADNVLSGELEGGGWSDSGYYGITDEDKVCLSMTKDKGRLRCMTIMRLEGTLRKYNAEGKMTFELLEIQTGKHL